MSGHFTNAQVLKDPKPKILVTKSNDDAMHYYIFQKSDKKQAKFPSWGNLPISRIFKPKKCVDPLDLHFMFWQISVGSKKIQFALKKSRGGLSFKNKLVK